MCFITSSKILQGGRALLNRYQNAAGERFDDNLWANR
jgi:hypothetical protein